MIARFRWIDRHLPGATAAQFRVSQTIGIPLGVEMWAESASIGGKNGGNAGPLQPFSASTQAATPQAHFYHEATGPEVMIGPFLGMTKIAALLPRGSAPEPMGRARGRSGTGERRSFQRRSPLP